MTFQAYFFNKINIVKHFPYINQIVQTEQESKKHSCINQTNVISIQTESFYEQFIDKYLDSYFKDTINKLELMILIL